jgi:hypothetical protein
MYDYVRYLVGQNSIFLVYKYKFIYLIFLFLIYTKFFK